MISFNTVLLSGVISSDVVWFRSASLGWVLFFERWQTYPGISIERAKMLFSEREGFRWYLGLPCGWRFSILR